MNFFWIPAAIIGLFQSDYAQQIDLEIATRSNTLAYQITIADNWFEQLQGLMHRKSLREDQGMLFVYQQDQRVQFWTKNVQFPIDMLFLDRCGTILSIRKNVPADNSDFISPDHPVRGVLEILGGSADRHDIEIGDKLIYRPWSAC